MGSSLTAWPLFSAAVWQGLVRVEDPMWVKHAFNIPHEGHGLYRLAVLNVVPLLQAQSMLGADAASAPGCPFVHIRLDGCQQIRVSAMGRDVQVEVPITYWGDEGKA